MTCWNKGDGSGSFFFTAQYPSAGKTPDSVAVGDFNGDGKLDLAVANYGGNNVSVLLNEGNGSGSFLSAQNFGAGNFPESVAVGDFNGDGKPDLAVSNGNGGEAGNVSVLLNKADGSGSFLPAQNYGAGSAPQVVAVGDFNGDGKPDLSVANTYGKNVSVLLNKGDGSGSFFSAQNFGSGNRPWSVAVGDFNGDGKPDLAVTNLGDNNVSILLNASY